jgi:hypothetical protein
MPRNNFKQIAGAGVVFVLFALTIAPTGLFGPAGAKRSSAIQFAQTHVMATCPSSGLANRPNNRT